MPSTEQWRYGFIIASAEKNIKFVSNNRVLVESLLNAFQHIYRSDTNLPLFVNEYGSGFGFSSSSPDGSDSSHFDPNTQNPQLGTQNPLSQQTQNEIKEESKQDPQSKQLESQPPTDQSLIPNNQNSTQSEETTDHKGPTPIENSKAKNLATEQIKSHGKSEGKSNPPNKKAVVKQENVFLTP